MLTKSILLGSLACLAAAGGAWAADVGKLAEGCGYCHGDGGNNADAQVPNIAGYSAEYLSKSLTGFKSAARPCSETKYRTGPKKDSATDMCRVAKELSEDDIAQLGEYFAAKKFVTAAQKFDPGLADSGRDAFDKKCSKCHSEGGTVASDDAGIIGGKKMAYVGEQIKLFLDGKRKVPAKMKPKLEQLAKEGGTDAVVHYLGSVK